MSKPLLVEFVDLYGKPIYVVITAIVSIIPKESNSSDITLVNGKSIQIRGGIGDVVTIIDQWLQPEQQDRLRK